MLADRILGAHCVDEVDHVRDLGAGEMLETAAKDVAVREAVVRDVERIGRVALCARDVRLDPGRIDLSVRSVRSLSLSSR